ncbi:hypothetical protein [Luteolibacter sp. LG18]|uniref:hypothetical protein n=1 Tax=Luteolibacter sp. LG18 TaxID=2819286 RepID=UPI002B2C7034|nr:hypothetical protein llg_14230 [Luteolibacter sp. LG18]
MKLLRSITSFAALTLMASGQETTSAGKAAYVLAKPGSTPPANCVITQGQELKNGKFKATMAGETKEGTCESSESGTEAIEFLAPDKIRRTVTAASKVQTFVIDGKENPQRGSSPLLNTPVIMTRSEAGWTAALEKGNPTPLQRSLLKDLKYPDSSSKDITAYGTAPRKIGDSWVVNLVDFPFAGVSDSNTAAGSVTITFKGIETFEGKKCARLEAVMDMGQKNGNEDTGKPKVLMKGSVVILRSLDDLIDLKRDFTGTVETSGDDMNLSGDYSMHETRSLK